MSKLSAEALNGFSDASSYDKHRPSYPPEAVSKLLGNLGVENVKGGRIIDVGAGTGKFTSLLAERGEQFEIRCVEPHGDMKEVLEKKFGKGNEGRWEGQVEIVGGHAAAMEVEEGWADAVIASQVSERLLGLGIIGDDVCMYVCLLTWSWDLVLALVSVGRRICGKGEIVY